MKVLKECGCRVPAVKKFLPRSIQMFSVVARWISIVAYSSCILISLELISAARVGRFSLVFDVEIILEAVAQRCSLYQT